MPTWLFEILFWGFMIAAIAWPIVWRIAVFTAAGNVYEAITRKPDAPKARLSADEQAEIMARTYARLKANGTPTVPLNVAVQKFSEWNAHQN